MGGKWLVLCASAAFGAQAQTLIGDSLVNRLPAGAAACLAASGKEGDIVAGVESRLRFDAPSGTVVIAVGVNDLAAREPAAALADYDHLLRTLEPGRRVIASAVLPVGESRHVNTNTLRARIVLFNAGLSELAQRYGADFLDATSAMAGPDGKLRDEYSLDGVHLSPQGSVAWAKALSTEACNR